MKNKETKTMNALEKYIDEVMDETLCYYFCLEGKKSSAIRVNLLQSYGIMAAYKRIIERENHE